METRKSLLVLSQKSMKFSNFLKYFLKFSLNFTKFNKKIYLNLKNVQINYYNFKKVLKFSVFNKI